MAWTAPDAAGRPALEGYDLSYCPTAAGCGMDSDWTLVEAAAAAGATGADLEGLVPDTAYELRVRAYNDEGAGAWSAAGAGRTLVPELALSESAVTVSEAASGNSATYTLRLGARPGGPVTVRAASDDAAVAMVSPAVLEFARGRLEHSANRHGDGRGRRGGQRRPRSR